MPRVREVPLDNLRVKIAPLSWDETEAYTKEVAAMGERKASKEEWVIHTLKSVALTINKAAGADTSKWGDPEWEEAIKKLTKEYDVKTILELHDEFLKISSLTIAKAGEAQATSISS